MKRKVILDVDTGSDDAIAIMCALLSQNIDVVAVCTVWGNTKVEYTTDNTLRLLSRMGRKIPVYAGIPTALAKYLSPERCVDGTCQAVIDGKVVRIHDDHLKLPESKYKKQDIPAPFFYMDYLSKAEEPVDIVAVGPLTNLGFALSLNPELVSGINRMVIMGGGYRVGNVTGYTEANFWHDPEAAQIVLDSGVKPVLVPLDATHEAFITKEEVDRIVKNDNFCSKFAADLLLQRMAVHTATQPLRLKDAATVHDALAVAYLTDPDMLKDLREEHINVCFTGAAEGHCVIDRRESGEAVNCRFAYGADRERFAEYLIHTLGQYEERQADI